VVHMNAMLSIRQHLKLSQPEFAEFAGADQPTVSRWDRGVLSPSYQSLQKLRESAQYIDGWNDSWLFDGVPE
jgi:DNA-binding transcriptional regulator YiaG